MYRVCLDQTGHLTLLCDTYILIFDNVWSPGQGTLTFNEYLKQKPT